MPLGPIIKSYKKIGLHVNYEISVGLLDVDRTVLRKFSDFVDLREGLASLPGICLEDLPEVPQNARKSVALSQQNPDAQQERADSLQQFLTAIFRASPLDSEPWFEFLESSGDEMQATEHEIGKGTPISHVGIKLPPLPEPEDEQDDVIAPSRTTSGATVRTQTTEKKRVTVVGSNNSKSQRMSSMGTQRSRRSSRVASALSKRHSSKGSSTRGGSTRRSKSTVRASHTNIMIDIMSTLRGSTTTREREGGVGQSYGRSSFAGMFRASTRMATRSSRVSRAPTEHAEMAPPKIERYALGFPSYYEVCLDLKDETVTVLRRYAEFVTFREGLMEEPDTRASLPELPPRAALSMLLPAASEDRKAGLQRFLTAAFSGSRLTGEPWLEFFQTCAWEMELLEEEIEKYGVQAGQPQGKALSQPIRTGCNRLCWAMIHCCILYIPLWFFALAAILMTGGSVLAFLSMKSYWWVGDLDDVKFTLWYTEMHWGGAKVQVDHDELCKNASADHINDYCSKIKVARILTFLVSILGCFMTILIIILSLNWLASRTDSPKSACGMRAIRAVTFFRGTRLWIVAFILSAVLVASAACAYELGKSIASDNKHFVAYSDGYAFIFKSLISVTTAMSLVLIGRCLWSCGATPVSHNFSQLEPDPLSPRLSKKPMMTRKSSRKQVSYAVNTYKKEPSVIDECSSEVSESASVSNQIRSRASSDEVRVSTVSPKLLTAKYGAKRSRTSSAGSGGSGLKVKERSHSDEVSIRFSSSVQGRTTTEGVAVDEKVSAPPHRTESASVQVIGKLMKPGKWFAAKDSLVHE